MFGLFDSYFDRPIPKSEWRMDIRNDEIISSVNIHGHPGHPGGNTFLAPQPLQGSSKSEQRPLPPAPCPPPGPTFRYSWYNSIFLCEPTICGNHIINAFVLLLIQSYYILLIQLNMKIKLESKF